MDSGQCLSPDYAYIVDVPTGRFAVSVLGLVRTVFIARINSIVKLSIYPSLRVLYCTCDTSTISGVGSYAHVVYVGPCYAGGRELTLVSDVSPIVAY